MAVNPSPLILTDDQFLLNRGGATFKTPFTNLAENVLNLVLEGGPGGDSLIELHDLLDVDTDLYIKSRNSVTGAPTLVASRAANNIDFEDAFWLLQAVNGQVSDEVTGGSAKEQFVLADAKDLFSELKAEVDGSIANLELNSLRDVTTRLGNEPGSAFSPHVAGDSFLLCVSEGAPPSDPDDSSTETLPDYQPRRLSKVVSDLIDAKEIEINLENNTDVNPIFIINPDGEVGPSAGIRLEVTEDFKNGIPNAVKYNAIVESKNFDDILVNLTGSATDDVLTADLDFSGLTDKEGNLITTLPAGWYYAENNSDGAGKLEPAGLPDEAGPESKGANVSLGGVRVLNYIDTVLEEDPDLGGKRVSSVGTRPSNIGITGDGVLYSEIPQTLTFGRTVDIVGEATDANGLTALSAIRFAYNNDTDDGNLVDEKGPGAIQTPESWSETAPVSLPAVGDFYVVQFLDQVLADGTVVEAKQLKATLLWNNFYPRPTPTPGPVLKVENGDIVAFGGTQWSVIGSVNTETIAQDLQDVTERGNATNQGIIMNAQGLLNGVVFNREKSELLMFGVGAGIVATTTLQTNKIDFDFIPELT